MSHARKNNHSLTAAWRPTATIEHLKARAALIARIRDFFIERDVLEVETPLLCHHTVTDPYIESLGVEVNREQQMFLQTSPEYAMKRLLASGSGAIYQICKAFRRDEMGSLHNPEFSLLEWYQPGYDHHQLMEEVDALLQRILQTSKAKKISYHDLFDHYFQFNPHELSLPTTIGHLKKHQIDVQAEISDRDTGLQLLLTHFIEPHLGIDEPTFIYDFPISQSALARINENHSASRFEVYVQGIELGNGFHELVDAAEQQKRFEKNNQARKRLGLLEHTIDPNFIAALQHGLPDCAGVAIGLDRLMMLALNLKSIDQLISFNFNNA